LDERVWELTGTVAAAPAGSILTAQHHSDPVGAIAVDGMWPRLLTMAALIVVTAVALLRPFVRGRSTWSRTVVVTTAFVAVVGELALAQGSTHRIDPRAAVLPVVLATTALALLPVLGWTRHGRVSGYLTGVIGVLALVLGTDLAAVGELVAGNWSGNALRVSALAWVAALAWFALGTPHRPAVARVVQVVSFAVAVAVVAAVPGFVAAGTHTTLKLD
jgi:hypothetical protein